MKTLFVLAALVALTLTVTTASFAMVNEPTFELPEVGLTSTNVNGTLDSNIIDRSVFGQLPSLAQPLTLALLLAGLLALGVGRRNPADDRS